MILISSKKLNTEDKEYQVQAEKFEQKNHFCFFANLHVLHTYDTEERKAIQRERYAIDRQECGRAYARLVDFEKHIDSIWDGKEERHLKIGPLDATERRFINALIYLNSTEAKASNHGIKHKYDYAWLYKAIIKDGYFLGNKKLNFKGVSDYVRYIKEIVKEYNLEQDIGDSDNINLYLNIVNTDYTPWHYNDHKGFTEDHRRNELVNIFIKLMDVIDE